MTDAEFQQAVLERLDRIEQILTATSPGALCNLREAARVMGVSPTTFRRRWVDTGEIRHRVGKRFLRADINRLKRKVEGVR